MTSNDPTSAEQYEKNTAVCLKVKIPDKRQDYYDGAVLLHNSPDKDTWRGDLNKKIDARRPAGAQIRGRMSRLTDCSSPPRAFKRALLLGGGRGAPTAEGAKLIAAAYRRSSGKTGCCYTLVSNVRGLGDFSQPHKTGGYATRPLLYRS